MSGCACRPVIRSKSQPATTRWGNPAGCRARRHRRHSLPAAGSAGMSIHRFAGSPIMVFLQALPLRIVRIHIFARSADFREKARSVRGALTSGGRHAISVPCAITSMMKNAGNPTMALNRGQNLRTCLKIMFVLSVQQIQKSFYGMGMLSSRVFHPCMINSVSSSHFFQNTVTLTLNHQELLQSHAHDPIRGRFFSLGMGNFYPPNLYTYR